MQAGQTTTSYDTNKGGNLTINLAITNSGDGTTTATVVLGYEDDYFGLHALNTWTPQTLNNNTPTLLSYTWETFLSNYLLIYPIYNPHFWVSVTDGAVAYNNTNIPIGSEFASASITDMVAMSSNAGNASVVALGVDTLAVSGNVTAFAIGHDFIGGSIVFYLDDLFGDPIGNVSLPSMTNNTVRPFSFSTNFSGMSTAPSFGDHMVIAQAMEGAVTGADNSSNAFTIVQPKSDVILTGMGVDQQTVTLVKGATEPVKITAHLLNNGTAFAPNATVHFFDGTNELNVTVTGIINVSATLDVMYTWNLGDQLALGNHTVAVGVDSQVAPNYHAQLNISVLGLPAVTITNLTADPLVAFETHNMTFTATLFNNGTDDAVNQTVVWWDATGTTPVQIGTTDNLTIAKGTTAPATFVWMAPQVERDTIKTVQATIGAASMSVNVTVRDEVPVIVMSSFTTTPSTFRIGDVVVFKATVMNNGSGGAIGMTVSFLDGTTVLATSAPFNLSVGSSMPIALNVTITGAADANHTFYVKESTAGVNTNMTVLVGHKLAPASVGISTFTVKHKTFDNEPKDSSQSNILTIVLKNSGEIASINCTLTVMEGKKVIGTDSILLAGNTSVTKTYTWKVSGSGDHKAVATLTGADTGTPATMSVKCTLNYTPGFEVLFLVAAIGVAAILIGRRKN